MTYTVPIHWEVVGYLEVEANNVEEAIQKAASMRTPLPEIYDNVDDTYEIDLPGLEEKNELTKEEREFLKTKFDSDSVHLYDIPDYYELHPEEAKKIQPEVK